MTVEEYLSRVLELQAVDEGSAQWSDLESVLDEVSGVIRDGLPDATPELEMAGSAAKGTMVLADFDLDVVSYLDNDDNGAGETLKEIYEAVQEALEKVFVVEPKRSAIELGNRKDGDELPFHVDVVPGRYMNDQREDVFLFQAEGEKNRLQTNLRKHVGHIQESGQADVIRLAKLWKLRCALDVKTFALELLVIEALREFEKTTLEDRIVRFWEALRDGVDDLHIEDPANPSGNDLAPIFGDAERRALEGAATLTLDQVDDGDWEGVFGIDPEVKDEDPEPTPLVVLDDRSHCALPPWQTSTAIAHTVSISASVHPPRGRPYALPSGGHYVLDGCRIRYEAHTTMPGPFEVRWQVVNTGKHAEQAGSLRGQEFFPSRARGSRDPSPNPMVTWERSEYTGSHTIQCFLVRDDVLLAASAPFELRVVNKGRKTYRPPRPRRRKRRKHR